MSQTGAGFPPDFAPARGVHLIGVGGAGVSSLARYLLGRGYQVSGSDREATALTAELAGLGVRFQRGHRPGNIPPETGAVVASPAIEPDNPERQEQARRRLPFFTYPQALGAFFNRAAQAVAVCGTHGKTTTAALVAWGLLAAGRSPSFVLGGRIQGVGGGAAGRGEAFVAEACEFRRALLNLAPTILVLNNLEEDHPDCYRGLPEIVAVFAEMLGRIRPGGAIVAGVDDPNLARLPGLAERRPVTFGRREEAAWRLRSWDESQRVAAGEGPAGPFRFALTLPGEHNARNALAAAAALHLAGLELAEIARGLQTFPGVARRFEVLADERGVALINDYAHHPTEIASALAAARGTYPGRRVHCLFQPHQRRRTAALREGFAAALARADRLVLTDIYPAREPPGDGTEIRELERLIRARAPALELRLVPTLDEALAVFLAGIEPPAAALLVGAGDVGQRAEAALAVLRRRFGLPAADGR